VVCIVTDLNELIVTLDDAKKLHSHYATIESKKELISNLALSLNIDYDSIKSKYTIHEVYNYILTRYYPNETAVKSSFINKVLMKGKTHVTVFELPISNSRADLCKINGESVVYEIKTELDNYSRLPKQINDYLKIFDKCFVICPRSKVESIKKYIPTGVGIYSYKLTQSGKFVYRQERISEKISNYDSFEQLNILRKSELERLSSSDDYCSRKDLIEQILNFYSSEQINSFFKDSIKKRYHSQWEFLRSNRDNILEIDYQWFFKNSVKPDLVYG
jgi:hypothetical protein